MSLLIFSSAFGICIGNASASMDAADPEGIDGYVRQSGTSTPISGASVSCSNGQQTTTNVNGYYAIQIFSYSSVTITVSKAGYVTQSKSAGANPRTGLGSCDFSLVLSTPVGSVTGRVIDAYNGGLAGATVSVAGHTSTTDSNGYYTVTMVSVGSQDVVATKSGYWEQTLTTMVTDSGTSTVNFKLEGNQIKRVSLLAIFSTVNTSHTSTRLEYKTGHSSQIQIDDYAAGNGYTFTVTWSATVSAGLDNTPSLIRQEEVWVSGSYSNIANGIVNVYVNSKISNYYTINTISEYLPSSTQQSLFNTVWTESVLPNQDLEISRYDSGSLALQAGLEIDLTTSAIFASATIHLECTMTNTVASSNTLLIRVHNGDTINHVYKFCLEGGLILHCWEL